MIVRHETPWALIVVRYVHQPSSRHAKSPRDNRRNHEDKIQGVRGRSSSKSPKIEQIKFRIAHMLRTNKLSSVQPVLTP